MADGRKKAAGFDEPESMTAVHPRSQERQGREALQWLEAVVIALAVVIVVRMFIFSPFVVSGSSMYPTLQDGERVIVNKLVYRFHPPAYDQIVVFVPPGQAGEDYIKRVIGLPGDIIAVRNGVLYRNGKRIEEPFINGPMTSDFPATRVPADHLFVMGDNRNDSLDSRSPTVGMVPMENLVGEAALVLWPPSDFKVLP
ncbi:MAG: signal peptidase I [Firmicutes bacterium]|nr:signal peptidase I [Bacillota bacterium]